MLQIKSDVRLNSVLYENLFLSNELIKVELPPWKIWKADGTSVSLGYVRASFAPADERQMLET